MDASWIWWGVAIYVVFATLTAYLSREGKQLSMSGYFLGNRQMGGFVSAMSYSATTYSAFMLIGLAGLTYSGGIGALGFELIYLAGVTLVLIFGPRFWLVGKHYGYVTPSEMLGDRYQNKTVAVVSALCSVVFLIPYAPVPLSVPPTLFFSFSSFLGLSLPWIFFSITNPQVSQRLFTPASMKDLRRMLLGFMVFGFIYTLVSVTWGLAALIQFPDLETGDLATPMLLSSDLVPTVLGIIVMIGIIAAAVSTIDSIMLTLSSMLTRDVVLVAKPDTTEAQQLVVGKLILPVIAVMAYLFAQLELNLIAVLSVSASAGLLVVVPPIIGAFFWKRGTAAGAISSIVVSGLLVFYLQFTSSLPLGQGSGVWGLLVSVTLFVGVSLATEAPEAKATEFLGHVKGKLKEHRAV